MNVVDKMNRITGASNDAELSIMLRVSPSVISRVRNGALPFGLMLLVRMHELTGVPTKELRAKLGVAVRGI